MENDGKPARERLTLIRVFEELRALGYEGSYDAVRRYARGWSKERASATESAYVPLSFAPGELVFDAHEGAFAFFKGACSRGIYDSMKTAERRRQAVRRTRE